MTDVARIQDQIRRAFNGAAWHGTPLRALAGGLTASQAAARPIRGAHTIWELVLHVTTWRDVVIRRIGGEPYRALSDAEDWKPMPAKPTPAAWKRTLTDLDRSQTRLLLAVGRLTDRKLNHIVPDAKYDFRVMLSGIVQHDLYHAGQIAVIRKLALSGGRAKQSGSL